MLRLPQEFPQMSEVPVLKEINYLGHVCLCRISTKICFLCSLSILIYIKPNNDGSVLQSVNHSQLIMNWEICFFVCLMSSGSSERGIKQQMPGTSRQRRHVLIKNVENGVFHGENKYIETYPTQQVPPNTISVSSLELEAEIEKRLGIGENGGVETFEQLYGALYGSDTILPTEKPQIFSETLAAEERRKLLNKLYKNQRDEDTKKLLNKINEEREIEEKRKLLNKIRNDEEVEERRQLLNKINEEQEAEERRKLLNSIYVESRPMTTDEILSSPYLGNRNTLLDQLKKVTPGRLSGSRNILNEMENLIFQLLRLGDAISSTERELMLRGIYARTRTLQSRNLC